MLYLASATPQCILSVFGGQILLSFPASHQCQCKCAMRSPVDGSQHTVTPCLLSQTLGPELQCLLELLDAPDRQRQLGLAEVHVSLATLEEVFLTVVKQVSGPWVQVLRAPNQADTPVATSCQHKAGA